MQTNRNSCFFRSIMFYVGIGPHIVIETGPQMLSSNPVKPDTSTNRQKICFSVYWTFIKKKIYIHCLSVWRQY